MTGKTKKKKVDFSVRPRAGKEALPPDPDALGAGRAGGGGAAAEGAAGPQKRLTLNLPAAMHTAFKGRCVVEGVTIQDKVRTLIEHYLAADRRRRGRGRSPFDSGAQVVLGSPHNHSHHGSSMRHTRTQDAMPTSRGRGPAARLARAGRA